MKKIPLFIFFSIIISLCFAQQGIGFIGVKKINAPSDKVQQLQMELHRMQTRQKVKMNAFRQSSQRYNELMHSNMVAAPPSSEQMKELGLRKANADSLNQSIAVMEDSIQNKVLELNEALTPPGKTQDISLKDSLKTIGFYGVGNLNTESFSNINASGKFAGYFRPYKGKYAYTTVFFSFNKNASNTDSLLAGNFLFPDVGDNNYALTVQHAILINRKDFTGGFHLFVPSVEFSFKTINGRNADSARSFTSLNFMAGCSYMYWSHSDNLDFNFSIGPLIAVNRVPEKYSADYKYLFRTDTLSNTIVSAGVKATLQVNHLSIYADCRNVFGSKDKVGSSALRGFNYSIGFIFNADIFEQ